jgi:hypothetical protein
MQRLTHGISLVSLVMLLMFKVSYGQPTQTPGTWKNVTDPAMVMTGSWVNGPIAVLVDPVRPMDMYVNVDWDGTWRSTDYGFTWKKASTGQNGNVQTNGAAVYAAIDMNPQRDPATSPTIYLALFQAGGIWKSTNFGVDWTNVWNNNIFLEDGVTNIFSDVGSDMSGVMITDSLGPNHLLAYLHGYWGSGNNNGVFESTNGGGKWVVHKSQTFNFTAHADVLFPIDSSTWCVSHGYPGDVYRTTNAGASWSIVQPGTFFGRTYCIDRGIFYEAQCPSQGIYKSANKGATWTKLAIPGYVNQVTATGAYLYAVLGMGGAQAELYRASKTADAVWTKVQVDMAGMAGDYPGVASTFDGKNWIIISGKANPGGLWRYVEPAAATPVSSKAMSADENTKNTGVLHSAVSLMNGSPRVVLFGKPMGTNKFYDINGKMLK